MQNYLAHHGIEGQRKGIRRFQNEDGSLTPAGKERYGEWHPGKRKKTVLKEIRNKNGSYRYNIESEDGSKVGNISTYHQSDDSLRVSWISVDKNHKREGYASGAMDTLFNQAKEKGYKKVTVVVPKDDANVQHIYERLGFKPSNDGLTNDEVEDSITSLGEVVKMEYELEHSDTLDDVLDEFLSHSAKGTVWKDHKYIKKEDGRYYYADDKKVSKTSSDELMDEVDAIQQQMAFCDQKAKEYDELAKSNPDEAAVYKAQAKKYRDEIERLNGEREQIAKGLEKKDKHDEIVNDFRNEPILDTLNKYKKNIYLGNPKLKMRHSDTLDDVLGDYLMHYGVSVDDGAPGPGSGRYPKGSGERPFQRDPEMLAKKKKGLFSGIKTALAKRKANTEIDRYRDYVDGMLNGSLKNNKALLDKYKELNERTDGKEFERGPFRYQYNVPDELSGKETDREKLAAEWKKFSEEVVDKHAKTEARNTALAKARETKAANKVKAEEEKKTKEEREAEKAKAIASGDPEQISKWLSEMSNQEQFDALNRIRQTKDIKSQAAAQVKAREDAAKAEEARRKAEEEAKRPKTKKELRDEKLKESFETAKDIMNTVDDVRQMAEKGIKFWNIIAAVNNASNPDFKLPKVDLNTGDKKKDKDKEENKENKEKDKNKNQQNNSGSTTNTNSNNTTYNTTNNYYNGEKKEDKPESETEAETWRPSGMEDWYDAPYKYEEAGKLFLEDFMKRKK